MNPEADPAKTLAAAQGWDHKGALSARRKWKRASSGDL